MKKETIIIPDRTIKLSCGDQVDIYVKKNYVQFNFQCDGTGNVFKLTKEELKEMLK